MLNTTTSVSLPKWAKASLWQVWPLLLVLAPSQLSSAMRSHLVILLVTLHAVHAHPGRALSSLNEDVDALSQLLEHKEPARLASKVKAAAGKLERAMREQPEPYTIHLDSFIAAGAFAPVFNAGPNALVAKLFFFNDDNRNAVIAPNEIDPGPGVGCNDDALDRPRRRNPPG